MSGQLPGAGARRLPSLPAEGPDFSEEEGDSTVVEQRPAGAEPTQDEDSTDSIFDVSFDSPLSEIEIPDESRARPTRLAKKSPSPQRRPAGKRSSPARGRRRRPTGDQIATEIVADPLAPMASDSIADRYHVVEKLGEGGMGKVLKVTHAQLGKTFALKIISGNFAGSDKSRELFYREARMASVFAHPNIASVVDFGEDESWGAFMVMEFLEGEPLSRILRRETRLNLRYACDIILQVAEALHYIHDHGVIHCDIKTENILICELQGTKRRSKLVKLLDFGLARSTTSARNTGSLSGTPHNVAPERIRGAPASPSADIYGLGILFYELVTGRVPWEGNVAQILRGHLEVEPPRPSEFVEGEFDPALENLILRALEKDPDDRHKDVSAFIYELRTVMDMLGFGRRGKRLGKRIIVGGADRRKNDLARAIFEATHLPMAVINATGEVLLANAAFSRFITGKDGPTEGCRVQETPLMAAWDGLEEDLARACGGDPVQHVIEVDADGSTVRQLLLWLDPGKDDDQAFLGVHPLDA